MEPGSAFALGAVVVGVSAVIGEWMDNREMLNAIRNRSRLYFDGKPHIVIPAHEYEELLNLRLRAMAPPTETRDFRDYQRPPSHEGETFCNGMPFKPGR